MKRSKTLVGLIVGILSLVGIVAIGCGGDDKPSGKKPVTPTTQGEWGVYYYDYNGTEYLLSLADGNKVTAIMGNTAANGKYERKNNDLTFTYTSDDLDVKSAKINADNSVITLTYNNVSMAFLRRVMYNVTFNTDSGSEVAAVEVLNGKSFSRPNDPVRAGYTFLGWYKDSEYKTPFIFESDIISANTTLYAQWGQSALGENVYTVSFDVGDYDGAVNPQPKQTVGGKLYNLEVPARDNYTFVGWWYSVTGNADELTYRVDKDTVYNENTTLYAVWQGAREGNKLLPPAVSVSGNRISWDPVTSAAQYRVQVQGPQTFTEIDRLVDTMELAVAFNTPGDYTVTVTAIASTGASNNSEPTVRTYKYNPLAKVSLFSIVGDTLLWNAVDNAEKYVVKVDCGNKSHNHDQFDNGQSTYFNFANCEMQNGGIKFTVTAVAEGYTSSVSEQFVYNKELASIAALSYDEDAQTVSWQSVPFATNYIISFNCGVAGHEHTRLDLGNKTSYCIKECTVPEGGLEISVTPYTKGYNSPAAAELTVTAEQKSLATPFDLRIIETTLSWSAVNADKYVVRIGDKEIETTTNSLDLAEQDINWTKGSDYNIRVKAVKGDKSSPWSDVADARYYAMYSTLKYNKNTVSWRHVIGAQGYEVRVNAGGITRVTNGTNFARVKLTVAGDNKVEVRFYTNTETSAWAPLNVNAYALTIDTRGGLATEGVGLTQYYAIGDEITLPTTQQITREGYTLGDLYNTPSGPDGNGSRFTDKTYTAVGDTVVYASWVPNTYKIRLNYNNGGTGVAEYTVTYGKPFRLPTPDTILDGTTIFGGWCANSLGTAASYTDENGNSVANWTIARDTEVYAKWLSVYSFEKVAGGSAGYYYMLKAGAGVRPITIATIPATYKGPEDRVAYPVTQIGAKAFDSCQGVEVINLPSTIDTIQPQAFESYTTVREINVYQVSGVVNDTYFSENGLLYYNNTTVGEVQLWAVPRAKTGACTLSDRLTEITSRAFYHINLEELVIPANVKSIENNAFYYAEIPTITFRSPAVGTEATTLRLEEDALYYANKMEKITLPARPIAVISIADGKAVTDVDFNTQVFRGCSALKEIEVDPNSAYFQSINGMLCSKGADATVLYCPKVREGVLEFPTSIVKIGKRAFSACTKITEVQIPNWITEIGEEAFSGYSYTTSDKPKDELTINACTLLEKVVFLGGDGVAAGLSIGKNAFGNKVSKFNTGYCNKLTTIEFKSGSGVTEIGEYAFARCPIDNIILPATLEELKEGAFYGCASLTTVEYAPNGKDITVGDQVFANCISITTIKLPANITQFNDGVFAGCKNLANIEVDPSNPALSDVNGVLFNKDQTIIIFYPAGQSSNYSIPATVTEISGGAFSDKENITDITIGKNVTKIGVGAFRHCVNLETVTFEAGGTAKLTIGASAFNGCTSLTSFKIPSRVTEIPDRMLMHTDKLTELVIPDTITSIGDLALAWAANVSTIEKIVIPASVGDIGLLAFHNCGAKEIEFTDKETGDLTIKVPTEKVNIKTVNSWLDEYFPMTLEIGQSGLFQGCSRLQKITLPKGLKNMPAGMFTGCSKLDEVVVPGTVTSLGSTVFTNCTSIKTITFAEREINPETGKVLALELEDGSGSSSQSGTSYQGVFAGCTSLTSIELPEGTTRIPNYAFGGCTSLESIVIPTTVQNGAYTPGQTQVTAIGTGAFARCSKLATVTFTPGGTGDFSLGVNSFSYCDKLTSITLPARLADVNLHVTQIYSSAPIYDKDLTLSGVRTGHITGIGTQNATAVNSDRDQYLMTVANRSFYNCDNLAEVNVAPGGKYYASDDGILYNADKTELVFVPYGRTKEVKVPYTVSLVRNFAFMSGSSSVDKNQVSKVTFLNAPAAATTAEGDGEEQPVAAAELRIGEVFPEVTHSTAKLLAAPFAYSVISSITFPDRLSYIGEYAFAHCNNLTSLTLPDATTKIDTYAFNNAKKLHTFTVNQTSKLSYIGKHAFAQTALTSFYLPPAKSLTLGENVFGNCTKLTSVSMPNTVASFDGLFSGSFALSTLNIYDVNELGITDDEGNPIEGSLTSDKGVIFVDGGKTLSYYPIGKTDTEYTIPAGVTKISAGAFTNNGNLKEITIPNTVELIGDRAFFAMGSLQRVIFEKDDVKNYVLLTAAEKSDDESKKYTGDRYTKNADNTYTKSEDGDYKLIEAAATLKIGETTTTSSTSTSSVFAYCPELVRVDFPKRLERLRKFAFHLDKKLTTVTFDEGCLLGEIEERVFFNTALKYGGTREQIAADPTHEFVIPDKVSVIDSWKSTGSGSSIEKPFGDVTKLVIPAGVQTVSASAFAKSPYLETVEFKGSTVEFLPYSSGGTTYTFCNCPQLKRVKLPPAIAGEFPSFDGCVQLSRVGSTDDIITGTDTALDGVVNITNSVTIVRSVAFNGCANIKKVILPSSLNEIGSNAFKGCTNLSLITMDPTGTDTNNVDPTKPTTATNRCYDLFLADQPIKLGAGAFAGTAITSAYIPWRFVSSGLSAAFGINQNYADVDVTKDTYKPLLCKQLKYVKFATTSGTANAVQNSIPDKMFLQLPALEEVVLPTSKVTTIATGAFAYSGLKRITIPTNITTINKGAFAVCPRLEKVYFEQSTTALTLTAGSSNAPAYNTSGQYNNYANLGVFAFSGTDNGRALAKAVSEAPGATQEMKDAYAANFKLDMSNRKITTTNKWTFNGVNNLDVLLSDETTTISTLSFQDAAIDKVVVPAKTTTIQIAAFAKSKVKEIEFAQATTAVTIANGTTVATDTTLGAFAFCSALTKVDMSKRNIATIPQWAFYNSGNFDVEFSSNTTTIGIGAFQKSGIVTVTIPASVTTINKGAFAESGLTSVTFAEGTTALNITAGTAGTAGTNATASNTAFISRLGAFAQCASLAQVDMSKRNIATISNYTFYGSAISEIKWSEKTPAAGETPMVTNTTTIGNYAFRSAFAPTVKTLNLPEGLTTIGTWAFNDTPLTTVIFPSTLMSIGERSFSKYTARDEYTGLTCAITIPGKVTTIGNYAFADTPISGLTFGTYKNSDGKDVRDITTINTGAFWGTKITEVSIPASLTTLASSAFYNSAELERVTFEDGCKLTRIENWTFGYTGLTEISIPYSIAAIGDNAFNNCTALEKVTFDKDDKGERSLTSIGAGAFGRAAFTSFEIPNSVTTLGSNPFHSCANLTTLTIEDGGTQFTAQDNVVYSNDKSILYIYAAGLTGGFTLPDSVVEIGNYAFAGSKFSGELTATKQGFTVGNSAFYNSGITGVTLGNSAVIDQWAFEACSSLTSVTLGESATVNKGAFSGCQALANVVLGANVKVGSQAFNNCEALTAVTLPAKATVDYTAFDGSGVTFDKSMLKDDTAIKYNYNGTDLNATIDGALVFDTVEEAVAALNANTNLQYVVLAEGITEIANNAFKNIANLKKIKLPNTLTQIGVSAFEGCGLEEVFIPKNVEFLFTKAFYNCKSLTKVVFEKGSKVKMFYMANATTAVTTTSDTYTFSGCSNLTSVTLPDSMEIITYRAFQNCTSLTSISIPATVREIYGYVFGSCTELEEVTFEKNADGKCALTAIGSYAFGYTKLSSISVPASVNTIGAFTFQYCASLESVTFEKDSNGNCELAYIGGSAFLSSGLKSISLPKTYTGYVSGTTVATSVFQNSASLTSVTFERDADGNCDLAVIGASMFNGTALTSISIPKDVTVLGDSAFKGTAITSVNIPKGVAIIGANAFDGCASLTTVTFDKDENGDCAFTFTGNYAFANSGLTSISLPKTYTGGSARNATSGVLTAATYVFYNCASLTSVTFEKDEDGNCDFGIIGTYAFAKSGITAIEITGIVTTVGTYAFAESKLESIVLPTSITEVSTNAFNSCLSLTSITWHDSEAPSAELKIGNSAFIGCENLINLILPTNVKLQISSLNGMAANGIVYFIGLPSPASAWYTNDYQVPSTVKMVWYWSEEKGFLNAEGKFENEVNNSENAQNAA